MNSAHRQLGDMRVSIDEPGHHYVWPQVQHPGVAALYSRAPAPGRDDAAIAHPERAIRPVIPAAVIPRSDDARPEGHRVRFDAGNSTAEAHEHADYTALRAPVSPRAGARGNAGACVLELSVRRDYQSAAV